MKKLLGLFQRIPSSRPQLYTLRKFWFCEKQNDNVPESNKQVSNLSDIKISHNYEKDPNATKKSPEEKEIMDNLIKDFLSVTNAKKEELEKMKVNIRDPMYYTEGPNVFKINTNEDINNILADVQGLFDNHYAFKKVSKIMKYKKQLEYDYDENFQKIRSMDRIMLNSEIPQQIDKNKNQSPNLNSPDFMKKQERYELDYNYNFEQHRDFTITLKKQKELDEKRLLEEKKYNKFLKENRDNPPVKESKISKLVVPVDKLPDNDVDISNYRPKKCKKSRRIYDRRLHDIDITNYDAWRCYDRELESLHPGDGPNIFVFLPPKYVIKAFGQPKTPNNSFYTGTYTFEDNNLDIFFLADYKQTTHYHGFNYSDEFYEKIQLKVPPQKRKQKHPEINEFWESEEPKKFNIYFSIFAEARKFRMWLRKMVEDIKDPNKPSKIEQLEHKYGKVDDYSDYNIIRRNFSEEIPVYKYTPAYFMGEGKSKHVLPKLEKPKYISPEEGELFYYEEYLLDENQKSYIREKENEENNKTEEKV